MPHSKDPRVQSFDMLVSFNYVSFVLFHTCLFELLVYKIEVLLYVVQRLYAHQQQQRVLMADSGRVPPGQRQPVDFGEDIGLAKVRRVDILHDRFPPVLSLVRVIFILIKLA
jgi:hypothetical protein